MKTNILLITSIIASVVLSSFVLTGTPPPVWVLGAVTAYMIAYFIYRFL